MNSGNFDEEGGYEDVTGSLGEWRFPATPQASELKENVAYPNAAPVPAARSLRPARCPSAVRRAQTAAAQAEVTTAAGNLIGPPYAQALAAFDVTCSGEPRRAQFPDNPTTSPAHSGGIARYLYLAPSAISDRSRGQPTDAPGRPVAGPNRACDRPICRAVCQQYPSMRNFPEFGGSVFRIPSRNGGLLCRSHPPQYLTELGNPPLRQGAPYRAVVSDMRPPIYQKSDRSPVL